MWHKIWCWCWCYAVLLNQVKGSQEKSIIQWEQGPLLSVSLPNQNFPKDCRRNFGKARFWAIEERKPVKWGKGGVKTCCLNTRSWDGSDKMPTHFQLSGVWSDLLLATFVNWGQEEPWLLEERESSRYI